MEQVWPLTGRAEELRYIGDAVRGTGGVVLAGAAGVGKTRLARDAVARNARRGAVVRWATATVSARALPLGAFAGLVDLSGPVDSAHLVQAALRALSSGDGRVLVAVDDAHLLDDLSAAVVHRLVLSGAADVVVTMRTGEVAPDAVTALWKDGHLARLEVQPLAEDETAALVAAGLGGQVDEASATRIWAMTQGNALYLRHLVAGEVAAGRLRLVDGAWQWDGRPQVTPALAELVAERTGQLGEPVRDVLDVLALAEPLEVGLLGRLTDPAAVEEAEVAGLIRVEPEGGRLHARVAHPLYGEAQLARCGALRARRLRARIAQALSGRADETPDELLRRAVLALDSDLPPDADLLTAAARRAVQLADNWLAERLARAALDAGGGFAAGVLLGDALSFSGRGAEAEEEFLAMATRATTDPQRIVLGARRTGNMAFTLGRPLEAERIHAEAVASLKQPTEAATLIAVGSLVDAHRGRTVLAAGRAAAVLAAADAPPDAVTLAAFALAVADGRRGRPGGLAEVGARVEALAESSGLGVLRTFYVPYSINRARCLAGLPITAAPATPGAAGTAGDSMADLRAMTAAGAVLLNRGRAASAARWLRRSVVGVRGIDPGLWLLRLLLDLVPALAMAGDVPGARAAMADLDAAWIDGYAVLEPDRLLARAWLSAAEGAVSAAVRHAVAAADTATGQEQHAVEVLALQTAVCFGERGVAERLSGLAGVVEGPRVSIAVAHARALANGEPDALLEVCASYERIGANVAAADAAAQAAALHDERGRSGPARQAAARAFRLAEACEDVRTPALAVARRPLPLTEREREIVTLAAAGLSNRDIAERLVVSVRTVEGHLYRANAKLGIDSRAKLAALLET